MKNSASKKFEVVNEGCEDEMKICGFKRSKYREITCSVFTILTLGILKLIFDWYPVFMVKLKCARSSLERSDFVQLVASGRKYFISKKVKYIWNNEDKIYEKLRGPHYGKSCSYFHHCQGLTSAEQEKRREVFGSNSVRVHVTPVLKLLYTQGLNPFYMFQVFSCTLWFIDQYYYFAACIIIMSVISLAAQIHQMRQSERKLKHTVGGSEMVSVYRRDTGGYETVAAENLVPGDIIEIPRAGCVMQCDAVLTGGICIVNESMLTGESIPVTKISVPDPGDDEPFKEKDHSRHVLYCGTRVIQTRFYDSQKVTAVVLHTGFMTAKGELVRSILFPKPVNFKFTQDSYKFLACLALVAGVGMIYTVTLMVARKETLRRVIVRTLDLVTIVIPPALPAAMTVGVVMAQKRLWDSLIYCINSNNINLCGAVDSFCFDKTGTLTEDGLDLKIVVPIVDGKFVPEVRDVRRLGMKDKIVVTMATCHSLTTIDNEIVGDPVDLKMFEATGWVFDEGESKFDTFVPTVVKPKAQDVNEEGADYGVLRQFTFSSKLQRMSVVVRGLQASNYELFCKGSPEMVASLSNPESVPENFQEVLISYTRKGYRVLALGHRVLKMGLVKVQRCQREQAEKKLTMLGLIVFENQLKSQTKPTVAILNGANIRPIMVTGDNLLTALSVARNCGMIGQKDRIAFVTSLLLDQSVDKEVKGGFELHWAKVDNNDDDDDDECQNGNCRIPMDCAKVTFKDEFVELPVQENPRKLHLAVTGKSWALLRRHNPSIMNKLLEHGTVFARFSPDQKQQLIESLIEIGHFVGMCGDGANDCGALKAAHAGISLSEAEASVASPFTSKQANISCVPNLIREGRAALVTSFGIFKFMAGYSLTQFMSVCLLYWVGANLTDLQFLYIDMVLLASLSFTFSRTHAFPRLVPQSPRVSLLAISPILSILVQVLVNLLFQLGTWFFVNAQPWFESYSAPPTHTRNFGCHEVTAVFSMSAFQYVTLAIVYSKGAPYRKTILTNYLFMLNIIVSSLVSALIVLSPVPVQWFFDLFQLKPAPDILFRFLLISIASLNFFISFAAEMFLVDLWLDKGSRSHATRDFMSLATRSSIRSLHSDQNSHPRVDADSVFRSNFHRSSEAATASNDRFPTLSRVPEDLKETSVQPCPTVNHQGLYSMFDWLPHQNEHQSLAELLDKEQSIWDEIEALAPKGCLRLEESTINSSDEDEDDNDGHSRRSEASASLIAGSPAGKGKEPDSAFITVQMDC